MIDRDEKATKEFRELCRPHLRRLPGWQYLSDEEVSDRLDAMVKFFDSEATLAKGITDILDEARRMPTYADIRDAGLRLCPPKAKHDPDCELCDGTGWRVVTRGNHEGVERCGGA